MSEPSSDITSRLVSREEYRAWCAQQPRGRFERIDGRIVRMAAERVAHARVKFTVCLALQRALAVAGVNYEAFTDGITVETGDHDFEPDALVNCGPPLDPNVIAATNPVIVVEVTSPSTEVNDGTTKIEGYFQVPSINHYLIVHPTRRRVIHHRRTADHIATAIFATGPVPLDPPGITVTVEELFGGV